MRVLKIASAAIAAMIVGTALLLVVGIPSSFVNATIRDRVERATGYRLAIAGSTRIGLWPRLNLTLTDVTLQDPKDHDGTSRIEIGSVQANLPLTSAWSGKPVISELVITRPTVHVPLLRNREAAAASKSVKPADEMEAVTIDRVKVTEGTLVFANLRDRVENRIDAIEAEATIGADPAKLKLGMVLKLPQAPVATAAGATAER